MTTKTSIPAEIILTNIEGQVLAFVNGERVVATKNTNGFIGRIEKGLRKASVYRQTGYTAEAGAFIASGQQVVSGGAA